MFVISKHGHTIKKKMKKIFIFATVFFLTFNFACTSLILEPEISLILEPEISFKTWTDSLSSAKVIKIYDSAIPMLNDARDCESINPFSYKDSITKTIMGTEEYPYSSSEGMTSVYYKKLMIFQNSWNYSYMESSRSITEINYGICFGMKVLKIENESHLPPKYGWPDGYYSRENRLFIERDDVLEEIDLGAAMVSYAFTEIRITTKKNVVIFDTSDFVRSFEQGQYLILFDLATKESKRYKY